jgi:hypothetical protein
VNSELTENPRCPDCPDIATKRLRRNYPSPQVAD